nr:hypothetical protein [Tanacetum cinerariifolium]
MWRCRSQQIKLCKEPIPKPTKDNKVPVRKTQYDYGCYASTRGGEKGSRGGRGDTSVGTIESGTGRGDATNGIVRVGKGMSGRGRGGRIMGRRSSVERVKSCRSHMMDEDDIRQSLDHKYLQTLLDEYELLKRNAYLEKKP